jgi:threonine dehydrogenase-like Zn-dependent dehydrogenase
MRAYGAGMAELWCPQCSGEFRAGITTCPDCSVALVNDLPDDVEPSRRESAPVPRFGPDEHVVELMRLPAVEAEMVATRLRDAGIRAVVFGVGTAGRLAAIQYAQGSGVMVSDGDLERAAAYVDAIDDGTDPLMIDDEDLAAQAEAAAGYSDPGTGAVV